MVECFLTALKPMLGICAPSNFLLDELKYF